MAFDAGFTRAMCAELEAELSGAKVERVTEPSRDEIVIQFTRRGKQKGCFFPQTRQGQESA